MSRKKIIIVIISIFSISILLLLFQGYYYKTRANMRSVTLHHLRILSDGAGIYKCEYGSNPPNVTVFKKFLLHKENMSNGNNPFIDGYDQQILYSYDSLTDKFTLKSSGADMIFDTKDDMIYRN